MNYYQALLLFFCIHFISISTYSQSDSLVKSLPPLYEYSFTSSAGILFPLEYQTYKGKNIIEPTKGYAIDFGFNYSYRFHPILKVSSGIKIGTSGREYLFKIDKKNFPDYAWVDENSYSSSAYNTNNNLYLDIPFKVGCNIEGNNKHKSWLNLGFDIFYLQSKENSLSYYCTDSLGVDHNIFNINYSINPERAIKFRFNIGYEYRFQFKNYNQLIIGINYYHNFSNMYKGQYEVFPDDNKYYGYGNILSNLNSISLEFGYSINNKKKQLQEIEHYHKTKKTRIIIPDTIPNKNEFRIGTNFLKTSWFPIEQAEGFASLNNNHIWTPHIGFSMSFMKYFRQNMAYYIGLDYDYGNYFFNVSFNKDVYQKDIPYTFTFNEAFGNIIIPIGFQYNYPLNNKSNLEFGTNLFVSYSSLGSSGGSSMYGILDSNQRELWIVKKTYQEENHFGLGAGIKLAYTITTKNQNKFGFGCQLNSYLTSHYTINVDIIQPDKTYQRAEIKYRPTYIQAFIFYSFTRKKKRFMKQHGY